MKSVSPGPTRIKSPLARSFARSALAKTGNCDAFPPARFLFEDFLLSNNLEASLHCTSEFVMCQVKQIDRNLSSLDARQHGLNCRKLFWNAENSSAAKRRGCREYGDRVCDVKMQAIQSARTQCRNDEMRTDIGLPLEPRIFRSSIGSHRFRILSTANGSLSPHRRCGGQTGQSPLARRPQSKMRLPPPDPGSSGAE
jgi:hypothetical protein